LRKLVGVVDVLVAETCREQWLPPPISECDGS